MIGFFLWIQPWVEIYFPILTCCPQLKKLGYPCVACGMSRDFGLILDLKIPIHNSLNFLFYTGTLIEMLWRLFLLTIKLNIIHIIRVIDYLVHFIALSIIFLYIIYTFINF